MSVTEEKNCTGTSPDILKNNNNSLQSKLGNWDIAPKKHGVSLKFENITFSANSWEWSLRQLTNGKCL